MQLNLSANPITTTLASVWPKELGPHEGRFENIINKVTHISNNINFLITQRGRVQ